MLKGCFQDLRERILEAVEVGASRREAAERFEVSASFAVKWIQRLRCGSNRVSKSHSSDSLCAGLWEFARHKAPRGVLR